MRHLLSLATAFLSLASKRDYWAELMSDDNDAHFDDRVKDRYSSDKDKLILAVEKAIAKLNRTYKDYLKTLPDGLSFLVPDHQGNKIIIEKQGQLIIKTLLKPHMSFNVTAHINDFIERGEFFNKRHGIAK